METRLTFVPTRQSDTARTPKGDVSKQDGDTCVTIPKAAYYYHGRFSEGRTGTFFTEPGALHEGQQVIVQTPTGKDRAEGTVQRANPSIPGKWFVQTAVAPIKH